jgi:hypothetical protein
MNTKPSIGSSLPRENENDDDETGCMIQTSKPVLIILGMMGRTPFAGVAWQVLHYVEGFRRLGFEVYYIEDTGDWPYDPEQNTITEDCRYTTNYIARHMAWCGLPEHWAYRAASQNNRYYGLTADQVAGKLTQAVALVNLTGATVLREEHLQVPVRVFLETDPVLPQIEVAQGRQFTIDLLNAHTHHFSYGENFGAPDCKVPVGRFKYFPTRQPIVLEWWPITPTKRPGMKRRFTTVASWKQTGKDIEWDGERYFWSKHLEFLKFIELPCRTGEVLELALACGDDGAIRSLTSHGWQIVDALSLSHDSFTYRDYILQSDAEFTVAKDQNIRLRSGWFSDRSACYLAAGKPVITQDTAFGKILPTGKGLFRFRTIDEVLDAIEAIQVDYDGNSRAAREIAAEFFAPEKVLRPLIQRAGL